MASLHDEIKDLILPAAGAVIGGYFGGPGGAAAGYAGGSALADIGDRSKRQKIVDREQQAQADLLYQFDEQKKQKNINALSAAVASRRQGMGDASINQMQLLES